MAGTMIDIDIRAKSFAPDKPVLGSIRLQISPGDTVALMGPSGIGKTTLLRLIAGLDSKFEGRIEGVGRKVGYVFQSPRLLPWRSTLDNLRIVAPDATDAALLGLLEQVGVTEAADLFPRQLSLGMARRVAIARALAIQPNLLLMDEPFASLDMGTSQRLREMLGGLLSRVGIPTLIVSHGIDDALGLADRVVVLGKRPATVILDQGVANISREDLGTLLSQ